MPWERTEPMLERMRFVVAVDSGEFSFAECCRRFGVSRKTGYKVWARYVEEGADGLGERSRAPHHCRHALGEPMVRHLLEAKHAHPTWGPRKLRAALSFQHPDLPLPARSTIGDLLDRHGLVRRRRRRHRVAPALVPLSDGEAVNELWCADFKGQFRLGDGSWCYPFTVTDYHSRYLLVCRGMPHPSEEAVRSTCERAFREYGLPRAIRTDNGAPFASCGVGGLSRLSVWWVKLGIQPQRIMPGRPQQNGRHERMHRTLKAEATRPASHCLQAQQRRFEAHRREFNNERPHESLHDERPARLWTPSPRPYPKRIPAIEYPADRVVRRVRSNGCIKWRGAFLFLSEALVGEPVGLRPISEDRWQIYFADLPLAILDEQQGRIVRHDV